MLFQGVQYFLGAAVFVTGIEGKIQHLLAGIPNIGRVVLFQLINPCISDGSSPFLPEGQSPGPGLKRALVKNGDGHHDGRGQRSQ